MSKRNEHGISRLAAKFKAIVSSRPKGTSPKLRIIPSTPQGPQPMDPIIVPFSAGRSQRINFSLDDDHDRQDQDTLGSHRVASTESTRSLSLRYAESQNSNIEELVPKDKSLSDLFAEIMGGAKIRGGAESPQFFETDFDAVSSLLAKQGKTDESRRPRLYVLLYMIKATAVFHHFVHAGKTDFSLPLKAGELAAIIPQDRVRRDFLRFQASFVSPFKDVETSGGKHLSLDTFEELYFRRISLLGRGRFASVDEVQSRLSLSNYAIKKFSRGVIQHDVLVKEVGVLKRLSHRHLVRLVGSFTDDKFFCILMSPVAEMHLRAFLDKISEKSRTAGDSPEALEQVQGMKKNAQTFYGCLANALAYLSSQKVRHKDVKPENILVKGSSVLLTDFGMSHQWNDENQSSTTKGEAGDYTPMYVAREVVDHKPRNSASDIWSLGCVFLEIYTVLARIPIEKIREFFSQTGNLDLLYWSNVLAKDRWIEKLRTLPHDPFERLPLDWIVSMTDENPRKRPTADELLRLIIRWPRHSPFVGECCASGQINDPKPFYKVKHPPEPALIDTILLPTYSDGESDYSSPTPNFAADLRSDATAGENSEDTSPLPGPRRLPSYHKWREPYIRSSSPGIYGAPLSRTSSVTSAVIPASPFRVFSPEIELNGHPIPNSEMDWPLQQSPRSSTGVINDIYSAARTMDLIPWDTFPDVKKLPTADKGVEGKYMNAPFCDAETVAKVQQAISTHLNSLTQTKLISELLQNGQFVATKICLILHLMEEPALLPYFLEKGKTDQYLPFEEADLVDVIADEELLEVFCEYQYRVLVRNLDTNDSQPTKYLEHELLPFHKTKELGSGGWAKVDEVTNVLTMIKYARKLFPCSSLSQADELRFRRSFLREIDSLRKLSGHQHIIRYANSYETPHALALLLSPVAQCDLHDYLHRPKAFRELGKCDEILWRSFGCLSSALDFIHRHNIRHKDIKSENILLYKTQTYTKLLLTDFGIAYDFTQASKSITRGPKQEGTDRYCSPEAAKPHAQRGRRTDIFSLGCVFLEIITALAGRKISDLYTHMGDDYLYRQKLSKIANWLDIISKDSGSEAKLAYAIKWCKPMLAEKMENRPYAWQLVQQIARDTASPDGLRSVFWCDTCRTELQERSNITHDKLHDVAIYSPNNDDHRDPMQRRSKTQEFDPVAHKHMFNVLVKSINSLVFLCTDFSVPPQFEFLRVRLKYEMMKLLNCSCILGLSPYAAEPEQGLRSNQEAVLNLLVQQKTLLRSFEQGLLERADSGSFHSSRSEDLEDSIPTLLESRRLPDKMPDTFLDCLRDFLRDGSESSQQGSFFSPLTSVPAYQEFPKEKFEHLIAGVTEKNYDLRRMLTMKGMSELREKDEQSNIGLLELFNTVGDLKDLVQAVLPQLGPLSVDSLAKDGWPVTDKVRLIVPSTPGLWSRQALGLFARFKAINLSDAFPRDYSILLADSSQIQEVSNGEILDQTVELGGYSTLSKRRLALFRKPDKSLILVWIEMKNCPEDRDGKRDTALARIRELAALLNDRDKPAEFRAPTCAGYFHNVVNSAHRQDTVGLIFEIPPALYSVEPISLFELFSDLKEPTWPEKMELAYAVASCLLYLHAASWYHKGINSYAVLFFRDMDGAMELGKPFLSGFDYSRPASKLHLSERLPFNPATDIYRHPAAQAEGTENYRRIFDIYGLGILLIEIANWKPIHQVLGFKDPNQISFVDVKDVRKRLLKKQWCPSSRATADQRKYAALTRACILGATAFGLDDTDDDTKPEVAAKLQASFFETVIQGLKDLGTSNSGDLNIAGIQDASTFSMGGLLVNRQGIQ